MLRSLVLALVAAVCAANLFAPESRPRTEQKEFTSAVPLLDESGALSAWGWGRRAVMEYNRDAIPKKRQSRIKEWEHYTIMSPEFTVGVTIVQLGSILSGSAELIDYKSQSMRNAAFIISTPVDRSVFPADPYGQTKVVRKDDFVSLSFGDKRRVIEFLFAKTATSPEMSGKIELADDPANDSIAITRPFGEGEFFYENKIFGLAATGSVVVDGNTYALPAGESWAIFDWGRGIWPHESSWFWGQAAGKVGNDRVAINLGHGYGDDSRGTCNAILVNGKLQKLDIVDCQFDPADRMRPWEFTSNDQRLTLTFRPLYQQHSKQDLGLISAELYKIHGHYSGTLVLDDGTELKVENLLGFAEHMKQRW